MKREVQIAECDICGRRELCKKDYSQSLPDGWKYGASGCACFCDDCSNFLLNHPKFKNVFNKWGL